MDNNKKKKRRSLWKRKTIFITQTIRFKNGKIKGDIDTKVVRLHADKNNKM